MNIIFLYGPPGVGKLTVAQELAKLTKYKLFHNHLTVDLANSVFDFGTKPYIEIRGNIWMMVFRNAKEEKINGLIFTFAPEESVPPHFILDMIDQIEDEQSKIYFVELICSPEELKSRIVNPSRRRYVKSMRIDDIEKYYKRDHLIPAIVKERQYKIDNTNLNPTTVAERIVNHFKLFLKKIS